MWWLSLGQSKSSTYKRRYLVYRPIHLLPLYLRCLRYCCTQTSKNKCTLRHSALQSGVHTWYKVKLFKSCMPEQVDRYQAHTDMAGAKGTPRWLIALQFAWPLAVVPLAHIIIKYYYKSTWREVCSKLLHETSCMVVSYQQLCKMYTHRLWTHGSRLISLAMSLVWSCLKHWT